MKVSDQGAVLRELPEPGGNDDPVKALSQPTGVLEGHRSTCDQVAPSSSSSSSSSSSTSSM
ncbi:hypothetical protein EYF80_064893 [Liparis tanakae]|uniref:Uncharacterized protein n=1 Tax=Liparis tanakae TaxID=230148 RepID=A0A4Z2E8T3_9TELE|nr:hypothetical protein EYF80_064893 [Liparis tanakae]